MRKQMRDMATPALLLEQPLNANHTHLQRFTRRGVGLRCFPHLSLLTGIYCRGCTEMGKWLCDASVFVSCT
jgi:hypothetical protein